MDKNCNLDKDCSAAGITKQSADKYNACNLPQAAPETVDGWLKALPMGGAAIKA